MKTALVCSEYSNKLSYYDDWADAFVASTVFDTEIYTLSQIAASPTALIKKMNDCDLIIFHHSTNADSLDQLNKLQIYFENRKAKLAIFVGNELNMVSIGMSDKISMLKKYRPDFILTQLLQEAGDWLYEECSFAKIISVPHALNAKYYCGNKLVKKIDIGTRTAKYSATLGDSDRNRIIEFFMNNHKTYGLNVDLGQSVFSKARFNRSEWKQFLGKSKATISTEAGSFYLQRDDQYINEIRSYVLKNTKKLILSNDISEYTKKVSKLLPDKVREGLSYFVGKAVVLGENSEKYDEFEEWVKHYFAKKQVCPVYSKLISSRHFDAIGMRCLNIMYPGRYSDILNPNEHYFELQKDHSNMYELVKLLENDQALRDMTNKTYEYVRSCHTHGHRLENLFKVISSM